MAKNENLLLQEEDELSVKEISNNVKELYAFFKLHIFKLIVIGIIGGLIGFTYAYFSKPIFSSKLRFIIKESGGGSSLLNSLGSLGSLIGGVGGTASPLDRTLAILGSEKIVGSALLNPIKVDGKSDLAINHVIEIQSLDKVWLEDSILNGVKFSLMNSNPKSLNLAQRKAYKSVLELFIGKKSKILERTYDKKSGVIDLTVNTLNENFSIEFIKVLYSELEKFMYLQSINSSDKNVKILANKVDSIKTELNFIQNNLARNTDRTLGLLMQEDKVDQKKLLIKEQMLTIMYGEAQKNLETFKFVNESISDGLEIIEYPYSPIEPTKKGKIKFTIFGILFFGIIGFSYFYFKQRINN